MALIPETKILKEDNAGGTGIVNQLTANDSAVVSYLNGGFDNSFHPPSYPGVLPHPYSYLDVSNIASLFSSCGAVYVKNIVASSFCNNKNARPSAAQIKSNLLSNSISANFDDLSCMIVNAFLPLTNIRYSEFRFMAYGYVNPNRYDVPDLFANAYLTDSAILGNSAVKIMQNRNDGTNGRINSRKLIDTRDKFVDFQYNDSNGIRDEILALRNDLIVKQTTVQNPLDQNSVNPIAISTVNRIVDLCEDQLNRIRFGLSCYFEDEYNDPENQVSVIYFRKRDGSPQSGPKLIDKTDYKLNVTYRYNYEKISQWLSSSPYSWGEPNAVGFRGWSTHKNPSTVEYEAGYQWLCLTKSYSFYPVLGWVIKYNSSDNKYTSKNPNNIERPSYVLHKEKENNRCVFEIVKMNTKNFLLPKCSNYFSKPTVPSGYEFNFLGWKQISPNIHSGNVVDYLNSELQTSLTINQNYEFKPVGILNTTPIPPPFSKSVVDLCITNDLGATGGDRQKPPYNKAEDQEQIFKIKIPVSGACSYLSGGKNKYHFTNTSDTKINLNSLGFQIDNNVLNNGNGVFVRLKVTVKNCANTWKAGYYSISTYQYGELYETVVSKKDFCTAETENNWNNFGTSSKWKFYDADLIEESSNGKTRTGYRTFSDGSKRVEWVENDFIIEFSPKKISNLSDTYIALTGKTGWSNATDDGKSANGGSDPNYPYRCRFRMEIVEAVIGQYF